MSKQHFYFIGIGGTAMASVASALVKMGESVSGSDSGVYPPMSTFLKAQAIPYHETYREENLLTSPATHIIVGNAISRGNPELETALNLRLPLLSMSEVIKSHLIRKHTSLVVTGTHGKTTTSSIAAYLSDAAGLNTGFLIGGIPENFSYGSRPVPYPDRTGVFIIEGDEYDTAFFDKRSKFLHYRPDIAIVNNIEFDHADIFSSIEEIELSFRRMIHLIPKNGLLLVNVHDQRAKALSKHAFSAVERFGIKDHLASEEEECEWQANDIQFSAAHTAFSIVYRGERVASVISPLHGQHNVLNALAAIAAVFHASQKQRSVSALAQMLTGFKSPKRRLQIIAESQTRRITLIDDFAHHPTAIGETLKAVSQRFPNRRIVAAFEPRSNTTTRAFFQHDFVAAFALASVVAIGAINRPERYSPKERLNPDQLQEDLRTKGIVAYATPIPVPNDHTQRLVDFIRREAKDGDVMILLSNGSFDRLGEKIISALELSPQPS